MIQIKETVAVPEPGELVDQDRLGQGPDVGARNMVLGALRGVPRTDELVVRSPRAAA